VICLAILHKSQAAGAALAGSRPQAGLCRADRGTRLPRCGGGCPFPRIGRRTPPGCAAAVGPATGPVSGPVGRRPSGCKATTGAPFPLQPIAQPTDAAPKIAGRAPAGARPAPMLNPSSQVSLASARSSGGSNAPVQSPARSCPTPTVFRQEKTLVRTCAAPFWQLRRTSPLGDPNGDPHPSLPRTCYKGCLSRSLNYPL